MGKRLNKLDRMSAEEKSLAIKSFWDAPNDAPFPPETIALAFNVSLPWLQLKRCAGDGIPFIKLTERKVRYQKQDVISFFSSKKLSSTSMKSS